MKRKYAVGAAICLVLCGVCIWFLLPHGEPPEPVVLPEQEAVEPGELVEPYTSPIDFETLQKQNPDIYAWLSIPGTGVSYPVLQNAEDDTLYLNNNADRKPWVGGALFTEHAYNSTDFHDPVNIIYGHYLFSGEMFGSLQELYSDDYSAINELIVYLPQEELHYRVFAGTPYSARHILYYYDKFQNRACIVEFVQDLFSTRAIGANIDTDCEITEEDHLLVLSTCLRGDYSRRFLVVGKLINS